MTTYAAEAGRRAWETVPRFRVWLEEAVENTLRARVTVVRDVESRETEDDTASSVEEIGEIVQRFVRSFVAD